MSSTTPTAIAERFVDLVAQEDFAAAHQLLHPDLQQDWKWKYLQRITGAYRAA